MVTEKGYVFFMRKRGETSIRKRKKIHRLKFVGLTLKLGLETEDVNHLDFK